MITCEEFAHKVSDYIEGRLPYGERIGIWLHTLLCDRCRTYLKQIEDVVDFMGEADKQESPDSETEAGLPESRKQKLMDAYREKVESDANERTSNADRSS